MYPNHASAFLKKVNIKSEKIQLSPALIKQKYIIDKAFIKLARLASKNPMMLAIKYPQQRIIKRPNKMLNHRSDTHTQNEFSCS